MKKQLFFLAFLVQTCMLVAQVSFTASVSKNKLGVNERFSLTYTVKGGGDRFAAPDLSDFSVLSGPSTSSSTTIINSKVTREKTYTYYLRAKKVGVYTIGSASIQVKGKQYRSGNVSIQVLKSSPQATSNYSPEANARENVFLSLELSNSNPYVGEQVVATYKLYFSQEVRSPELLKDPSYTGFWHEDYDLGENYPIQQVRKDGKTFKVATLKKLVLIPQRSGTLTLDAMDLEVPVAIPTNQRDFFGRIQSRIITIICSSGVKVLSVKSLPTQGKPVDFSGAVGVFEFTTRLDRDSIQTNESATLSMRISGTGNLRMIDLPNFKIPNDLEAYEPKFKEKINLQKSGLSGYKRVEHLLIPRNRGDYKISVGSFNYFNPKLRKFITVEKPSYTLNVEGDAKGSTSAVIVNNITKEDVSFIGKDILYIKTSPGDLQSSKDLFFGSVAFKVLCISLTFLVIIALFIAYLLRKSIIDFKQWKRGGAMKQALKVLDSDSDSIHTSIQQALQVYFQKKWGLHRSQFDKEIIEELLCGKSVDSELVNEIVTLLETCEMARFTKVFSEEDKQASTLLNKTKNVIERLENY
ncbi:MAG: BatD family protein [Flavobacteriales bacterium]|mgnify:FL=1|nr:BatD family protein [Flavobacteriales bacterium]